MTTTTPVLTSIECNGCRDIYENYMGWTAAEPGVMRDSAIDSGWIEGPNDEHWCRGCQHEGKVPDDAGHKPATDDGEDMFCANCEDDWPCAAYEAMHPERSE
jgi:hypothetical protein